MELPGPGRRRHVGAVLPRALILSVHWVSLGNCPQSIILRAIKHLQTERCLSAARLNSSLSLGNITVTLRLYAGGMIALDTLLRQAFIVCAILALPAVVVATVVGSAIAVLQAATQIHEQTLTLLPKLLAVGALVVLFGAFGMRLCAGVFASAISSIPALVRGG